MRISLNRASGFTIVELLVVITVLGLMTGVVLNGLGTYYQSNTTSLSKTTQDTDTRTVLRTIEKDIANSSGFLPAVTSPVSPFGSDDSTGTWSYCGVGNTNATCSAATSRVLITSVPTSTIRPDLDTAGNRKPVFNKPSSPSTCSTAPVDGGIATVTYIYFVKKDPGNLKSSTGSDVMNLYRRTIVPDVSTLCDTPWQKSTCSPTKIGVGACTAADAVILRDVSGFNVDYYPTSNATSPQPDTYTGSVDQATREGYVTNAQTIQITVTTNQRTNGTTNKNDSSIRISRY